MSKLLNNRYLVPIITIAVSVYIFWPTQKVLPLADVKLGNTGLQAEVAQTDEARAKGLSDRLSLPEDKGMLFIFPTSAVYGFWMKDMHFPLDMIWVHNGKVIAIDQNVQPESNEDNLRIYRPLQSIEYVVEVNAGFAESHGINVGDEFSFKIVLR